MDKIAMVDEEFLKKSKKHADFKVGDTVRVFARITEEKGKTRLQAFEGIVIARKGSGIRESFTVRRISFGEGVERIFPLHSPTVDRIVVTKRGKVRRAKLYYMRERVGKEATRISQADEDQESGESVQTSENSGNSEKTEKAAQTAATSEHH